MTHSDISKKANELYQLRQANGVEGTADEDWQRAIRILDWEEFIEQEYNRIMQPKEINK